MYKVDAFYAPESDAGIHWADPALGIDWPVAPDKAELSPKDQKLPRLADILSPFTHGATP
jgi:dTDP-4-dehydrorhamnose 3,5-epimerase